jgi:outer membrane protein insertion porin family
MFPFSEYKAAAQYTYNLAQSTLGSKYTLREPRKTFRFTVATTF